MGTDYYHCLRSFLLANPNLLFRCGFTGLACEGGYKMERPS